MDNHVDLSALNKSSAIVADFAVRLSGGRVIEYSYTKKDGSPMTAHKFEIWLVGTKPESYCIGFIKGAKAAVTAAQARYTDGSIWMLSKVALDTYTQAAFISTPVPFRVDLAKSTMNRRESDDPTGARLRDTMPTMPIPPRTVADVARITTNRPTDLIAVVKQLERERESKGGRTIADVDLIDDSQKLQGPLQLSQ